MLYTYAKTLRVYVGKQHVHLHPTLPVAVANGYRVYDADSEYPYVELSDIPLFQTLWPDLDEVKVSIAYIEEFECEKELKLGWFHLHKGKTVGILKKIGKNYHLHIESFELRRLLSASYQIRYGHVSPKITENEKVLEPEMRIRIDWFRLCTDGVKKIWETVNAYHLHSTVSELEKYKEGAKQPRLRTASLKTSF